MLIWIRLRGHKYTEMAISLYSTLSLLIIVISSPCLAIYTISDYRLITKDRPNAGIVVVFNQDIGWGLVCQNNWNFELASLVCSQLNFPGTSLDLTALAFNDDGDEWPMSVTYDISTYFTGCTVDGTNMRCETCDSDCYHDTMIGAVSCKEPGYIGCFSDFDPLRGGRVLSNRPSDFIDILTIDLCINACEEDGYFYAGVKLGSVCSCGGQDENLARHGTASDGECYYVCAGDHLESCGSSALIAIYQVGLGVCEDPGTPQNGFRYKETGPLRYGSEVYFNCSDGYTLEGPDVIQCVQMDDSRGNDGIVTHAVMWNQGLPKCTGSSSTTPFSATTKGGGQTNSMTFSGIIGPEQQSGFSSTTPSSATTKGGGQTNPMIFSGTTGPEQQSGFSSTTPSSSTTKGGGLTTPMTFTRTTDMTGSEQQSGHLFIILISIGIMSGLFPIIAIIAIIVVVVIWKRHRRGSNIALRQSVCDREGQELNPYPSSYTTTMRQPAYEDIKATRHGNRGHTNAIEMVKYKNQTIFEHPYTALDATTMEQPAYDDTIATTRGDRGQMSAIEGVEYENQRIAEQTARVKKSNLGVAHENTEPVYEFLY